MFCLIYLIIIFFQNEGRRKPDYWQMWPIALAPSIPIIGMAFKNHPRVRNILIGGVACGVLVYAHGAAVGGSKDVTG